MMRDLQPSSVGWQAWVLQAAEDVIHYDIRFASDEGDMARTSSDRKGDVVTFRVSPSLKTALAKLAEREAKPVGELLRELVRTRLDRTPPADFQAEARRRSLELAAAACDLTGDEAPIMRELEANFAALETFEASGRFPALLERVAKGEKVVITQGGKPVAQLVAINAIDQANVNNAVEELKRLRKGTTLGGLSWKKLRDEGRR
jgi:prevent-host-death family protein